MVYKVVIAIHPEMLKNAKKLGMNTNTGYITIYMVNVKLDIRSLLPNVEKGRFIAIYNPNNAECNIYTCEDSSIMLGFWAGDKKMDPPTRISDPLIPLP